MTKSLLAPLLVCLCLFATWVAAQEAQEAAADAKPSQEELEKKFAETMSGATLVGRFTISGVNDGEPLKEDRYTLGKVYKLKNGLWSFEARIQYGDHDVKLPLALTVEWAGDTPVITVTKVAFPGLGTYTARVLVYDDQYAGTWSGSDHGGQMFGKIVPAEASTEKSADN
ncbi:MAG: hypothetical protein DWQ37_11145 [Planctomycetota bacterium]|nr:MAG: hypothetical protein DWQ37_11145 [Planctomycetota bacterium]